MDMVENNPAEFQRVPVRDGLLAGDLRRLDGVRLAGTRCHSCGEVSLGQNQVCLNCGGDQVSHVSLSDRGMLWSYTIVRNRPPGDYKGPDPFKPFGIGLVELPDGIRVMSPLDVEISDVQIGMPLQFRAFVQHVDAEHHEVIAFKFTGAA